MENHMKRTPRRIKEYVDWPVVITACADWGVGTITLGEMYMVKDEVWRQAWAGRRKSCWHDQVPGTDILCIGCLEQRIGRRLVSGDFTDAPINDPDDDKSERLRNRIAADSSTLHGAD